ncbi:thioredoxin [Candidatus Nanohalococcus occultus]|uniref:Thioredoxin n=1 Tax=Candidatus Nanohalococcus occultus TaxID=2978047 RepID=A0ABY8CF54_9ARCH|nr:Thioredoxin [Candidatus Nanohaloarchaeota archaeon SVXNc]
MPEEITEDNFEDVKNSDDTWVIDFWAEWCGPCKQYAPTFKEVSEETEGVKFGKIDMEAHQQLGTSLGVRALPTTIVMKNGEEVDRKSGAMSKQELLDFVEKNT